MSGQVGTNRAPFTWAQVKHILGAADDEPDVPSLDGGLLIEGVTTDSRAVEAGNLFVALRGEKFDGHEYLAQVKAKGAVAVVVDRECEVDLPQVVVPDTLEALGQLANAHRLAEWSEAIPFVAVTGSYGKTSTRAFIAAALRSQLSVLASEGNFNNEIGLPLTLLQLDATHETVVLEMGMRGRGQIATLARIAAPTIGVITNVGPQHIEVLETEKNIAFAKAELLEALPSDGLAVLPADSPWLELLQSKATCRLVTFGAHPNAAYRVERTRTDDAGNIIFDLSFAGEQERQTRTIRLPLPGAHNAVNAAAAFAVAHQIGVPPDLIVSGLEGVELPGARMRVISLSDGTRVIDDCYNAGPNSMRAALQTLLDFPGAGRRVAILGAMRELGAHSESEHVAIGRFAGTFCDVLVGVAGETRPLLNAALAAAREVENEMPVAWCADASEAAARLGEWVQAGDVVLVKGSRSIGLETVVEALTHGYSS